MTIEKPDLAKTKPYKDFGRGFYLSADETQARRMAEQRTLLMQVGEPTITRFLFDEQLLYSQDLKVRIFEDYSESWAAFVLKNRDISLQQPSGEYDIVYGPIADDGVTFQLRRYKAGSISLQELVQELRYARGITYQYYFGTELALSKLTKL